MKIKQMLRWNWQNSWLSLLVVYGVMMAVCVLTVILVAIASFSDIHINGVTISSTVMLFVVGIVLFSQSLRFGLANGVSRRSVFWGFGLFMLAFAVIVSVADVLLSGLFGLVLVPTDELLPYIYQQYTAEKGGVLSFVALTVCSITLKLLTGLFGYFIGGAYYRMNKPVKLLVSIGVPVTLFILLPIGFGLLPSGIQNTLWRALLSALKFLVSSPYALAAVLAAAAVLFYFFSWLFIRRAPAKATA